MIIVLFLQEGMMSSDNTHRPWWHYALGAIALALITSGIGYLLGRNTDVNLLAIPGHLFAVIKDISPLITLVGGFLVGGWLEQRKLQNTFRQKMMDKRIEALQQIIQLAVRELRELSYRSSDQRPGVTESEYLIWMPFLPDSIQDAYLQFTRAIHPFKYQYDLQDHRFPQEGRRAVSRAISCFTSICHDYLYGTEHAGTLHLSDEQLDEILGPYEAFLSQIK